MARSGSTNERCTCRTDVTLPSNDYRRPRILRTLLSQLAETAPHDALAMADEIGSLLETERARIAIIREWARYDLAASAEWLNSQPSSPALDRAVMSYTYRAAQEDPGGAMTWAESINNDWMRTRMLQHVAASWKEEDQESFQSYIDNSEFDEDQKKQLHEAQPFRGRGRAGASVNSAPGRPLQIFLGDHIGANREPLGVFVGMVHLDVTVDLVELIGSEFDAEPTLVFTLQLTLPFIDGKHALLDVHTRGEVALNQSLGEALGHVGVITSSPTNQ